MKAPVTDALVVLGAFLVGGAVAGGVVYLAARRTEQDLTGAGADMQAAFEAAGRLTASQLQAHADAFARDIARIGAAKIAAAASATAMQTVQVDFGITPQFIADARAVTAAAAATRANPFGAVAAYITRNA